MLNIVPYITNDWIFTIGYSIIFTLNLVFAFIIITENRNPIKSLGWIATLILLPIVGFIFYLFFGMDHRSQKMISKKGRRKLKSLKDRNLSFNGVNINNLDNTSTIRLGHNMCKSILTTNNCIEPFYNGADKFEAMIRDIEGAKSSIHIQYYIIEDDKIGNRVLEALLKKRGEGVEVRVLYDAVGCWSWLSGLSFFKRMNRGGIDAKPFFKVTFPQLASKLNYRNHRKVVVIDGLIGYLGGMNIADRYLKGVKWGVWRDTHIRVMGDVVHELQSSFLVDWNFTTKELLSNKIYFPKHNITGDCNIQIVTSGPLDDNKGIAMLFLRSIGCAKSRIYIQTPYFLPSLDLAMSLQAAALSGVDVRVMLPEKSDSRILQFASHSYIKQMLDAGVKIYLYKKGLLHCKCMMIDNEFATVGSTNFDFRSFEQNFEINAFAYNSDFNKVMIDRFKEDILECTRVKPYDWDARSNTKKIKESFARLLSPIL